MTPSSAPSEMEWPAGDDIEELALCPSCRRAFDDARPPKLLACRHHVCLACARGRELRCALCGKRTPGARAEGLPTHGPLLALARRLLAEPACAVHALPALWCCACAARACRACHEHAEHAHALRSPLEARALLARDSRELLADLRRLSARRRDVLLRALDAATALKLRLEAELSAPPPPPPAAPASLAAASEERDRLRARHAAAALQSRLDDLVRGAAAPLDRQLLRAALGGAAPPPDPRDPLLFLANYCAAELCGRRPGAECPSPSTSAASASPPPRPPSAFPLFFFSLQVDGRPFGRVVIEVRSDVAPRMARNFAALAARAPGAGYRGCAVFQCWAGESVITGDFELNDGRGGRAALPQAGFLPDESRLAAVRGAVGMRRSRRRRDRRGLVGSQFRIVLREMRGFTAIFAAVVEGLELVDRLSRAGDSAGKPHCSILISDCGKLN